MHEEELLQDPGNTFETHLIIVKSHEERKFLETTQEINHTIMDEQQVYKVHIIHDFVDTRIKVLKGD